MIVASSSLSLPQLPLLTTPLTSLLFMMSHKWRACSQAKDDDDDDDDDDNGGSDDDGDDDDDVNDDDDHHDDDQ